MQEEHGKTDVDFMDGFGRENQLPCNWKNIIKLS